MSRTTGDVVVHLVVRPNGSVDELLAVSGDPILMESTLKALRHWRIVCCRPIEYEMTMTFTFRLLEGKPAFLHLWYGPPIRVEEVREYTDGMEFLVAGTVYRIPSGLVAYVDSCRAVKVSPNLAPDECVPAGGPNFLVRALPLLPAKSDSTRQIVSRVMCSHSSGGKTQEKKQQVLPLRSRRTRSSSAPAAPLVMTIF